MLILVSLQVNKKLKVSELENKIPSNSGLVTVSVLITAVENKIPSISNLVKKIFYDTTISDLEKKLTDHKYDKYITTPKLHKLTAEIFAAKSAEANLVTNTKFDAKRPGLDRKIFSSKTKYLLLQNQLKKLETIDSIYFCGKSHFEHDGTQYDLVFQSKYKYLEITPITNKIMEI